MTEKIVHRIERVFKGVANHNRIKILEYIVKAEDDVTLWQISQSLNIEMKNVSQHTARLEKGGLIEKRYIGRSVIHIVTPYGKKVYEFMKTLK